MPKIRKFFCKTCNEVTEHSTIISRITYTCKNAHPNDKTHCRRCGSELDKDTLHTLNLFGAAFVLCRKCTKAGAPCIFPLF